MCMLLNRIHFFAFSLLLLSPLLGTAQKYSIGVKGGVSLHWAGFGDKSQKDTFSTSLAPGYSAGFQIGFPLKRDFRLMLEGAFAQKKRLLTFDDGHWKNHTTFNIIEGNMLLRKTYQFNLGKNVPSEWFFELGPEVNYIINASGKIVVNDGVPHPYKVIFEKEPDFSFDRMFYKNANRWLFGLVLGVGFKAPLKNNHHLTTQLRFVSGHTYLGEKRSDSTINLFGFEDTLITNIKTVSLTLAYTLEFDTQQSRKGKSTLDKKIKKNR